MAKLIEFPGARRLGFQRVQSAYTVREITRLFGIPEKYLTRWIKEGLLAAREASGAYEFDVEALDTFRSIRDRRGAGTPLRQIDEELRGQLGLFPERGRVVSLPSRRGSFFEGLLLFDRGDSAAREAFLKAAQEDDHAADAWCNLGIIAHESGAPGEAMDCFTRALACNPRHFESHFNLGNLYAEMGSNRPAEMHYAAAREIEPDFPDTYFNLALVFAAEENWPRTAEFLEKYASFEEAEKKDLAFEILGQIQAVLRS